MQIINVTESGANNILKWAIANNANLRNDVPLQSIINDESFYLVTLSDVNFFELFRLTQCYRSKIRVINEERAVVPARSELVKLFPGGYTTDESKGEKGALCEAAEYAMSSFINMVMQMSNDDDIIKPSACRLFLPMLTRKFTIQIPVSFMDLIGTITEEEACKLFTDEYPNTLSQIIDNEVHSFKNIIAMGFVRNTSIIRYDKRYDQYVKTTKYFPLNGVKSDKLYKFGLLGFSKLDPISKGEIHCDMFAPDVQAVGNTLKKLSTINSPLEIDFVVQLPIQYMQMLQSSYDVTVLPIYYESSMADIIDNGIVYNDFITYDYDTNESEDETDKQNDEKQEHINKIDAYRIRISEANQVTMNTLNAALSSTEDIDITGAFSMLPSIYTTRAVMRLNVTHANKYLSHYDPIIKEMFGEMLRITDNVSGDIVKSK